MARLVQQLELVTSPADLLQERTEAFAVRVLQFVRTLPQTPATDGIARQLARSGPSVFRELSFRAPFEVTKRIHRTTRHRRRRSGRERTLARTAEEGGSLDGRRTGLATTREWGTASDLRKISGNGAGEQSDPQIVDPQIVDFLISSRAPRSSSRQPSRARARRQSRAARSGIVHRARRRSDGLAEYSCG